MGQILTDEQAEAFPLVAIQEDGEAFSWRDFLANPDIPFDDRLDIWEAYAAGCPQVETPLSHKFLPGLYVREIKMPAGSVITSRIHKFASPFFITSGKVIVVSENEGCVLYEAPHSGVTLPETRRLLLVLEDTIWATVHPNPDGIDDVDEITNTLTYVRDNPHLLTD